jgi:hypothetical protein
MMADTSLGRIFNKEQYPEVSEYVKALQIIRSSFRHRLAHSSIDKPVNIIPENPGTALLTCTVNLFIQVSV